MGKSLFLVQSDPVVGQEAEYNDWYTNTHLRDVVAVPGIVSAQRFELSPTQRNPALPPYRHRYIAVYEIEGDPAVAFHGLDVAKANGMYVSPAMAPERVSTLFTPITDRILQIP